MLSFAEDSIDGTGGLVGAGLRVEQPLVRLKQGALAVQHIQRTLLEARERLLDAQASAYQAASSIDRILGE